VRAPSSSRTSRAHPGPIPKVFPQAGLDEAGRGCLAGPVVAAAVILPDSYDLPGLTDSKKLSPGRRDILAPAIKTQSLAWAVGAVWPAEIDRVNILPPRLRPWLRPCVACASSRPWRFSTATRPFRPPSGPLSSSVANRPSS
jgi:hypothetical protein